MDTQLVRFEDRYCYYFWKKHGIASTWGLWPCFLDSFDQDISDKKTQNVIKQLQSLGKDNEYGLLNRLDTDTAWLLYFAKDIAYKKEWKTLQEEGKLVKYYLADVRGDISWQRQCIAYPIIHHPQSKDRMVCIQENVDTYKSVQFCETRVEKLYYDPIKNYSCLLVMISKWVRHQIRCHLASIWCPIIGEKIYKKKKDKEYLHLWSIWVGSIL